MKVLVIDGIADGAVLAEIQSVLAERDIETEVVTLDHSIQGCIACGKCNRRKKCIYEDEVNIIASRAETFSGMLVLCPLYYGEPKEAVTDFMTRLFRSASFRFAYLPASALYFSRGKAEGCCDAMQPYFAMAAMPCISDTRGNVFEMHTQDDGIARAVDSFAWLVQCISAGRNAYRLPQCPEKITDFVR